MSTAMSTNFHLIKIICTHRAEEEELDILGNTIYQPDKCASEVRACEAGVPSASFPTAGEHSSWNIHLPIHHYHYQLSIIKYHYQLSLSLSLSSPRNIVPGTSTSSIKEDDADAILLVMVDIVSNNDDGDWLKNYLNATAIDTLVFLRLRAAGNNDKAAQSRQLWSGNSEG